MSAPALPRPDRRTARGFTLVEVLVGALVLGIFISFVYGAALSAFQVREVVQSTTAAITTGSVAVDIVARDLECALLRPFEGGDAFKAEDEGADRARLDFVTTTDSRGQEEFHKVLLRSDVTEVGYRTRTGDDGLVLYRREQFGVDDKPLEGGDWFKVADGVKTFRIEWFEKDPSEDQAAGPVEGLAEWDAKGKHRLPRAAKITLVLEGQSSDPAKADTKSEFRFTRWVVLPGADDTLPEPPQPGGGGGGGGGG